jgi:hypothetical protein
MGNDGYRNAQGASRNYICDSVPRVGRSLRAYLAFTAALGLSGCLLFTDPINKAPVVTINPPSAPVMPGIPADFTATVTDDKDRPTSLLVDWAVFDSKLGGCNWITPSDWPPNPTELDSTAPYAFTMQSSAAVCLCARATDHNGASGQSCYKITTATVATIVDVSGAPSEQPRPLCSQVHLSAENSLFPAGDSLKFNWGITYDGTDPAAKSVQLSACTGSVATCANVGTDKADQHRWFYAGSPGTYTVTLSIQDTAPGSSTPVTSTADPFVIPVDVDTPPCIKRTDPDVYAQRILLSRSTDLGGTYQSRTFKVLNVADDCEPYPLPAGSTNASTRFVWSVLDSTQASPTWTYQTNTSDSFTVSQALFPNARPGDTVQLRVEARDTVVEKIYQAGGQICAPDVDICCGSTACGTPNDCVRWTTWTVQFQP